MNTFISKGINLNFERKGFGTPLLLIHGFPLDHHTWDLLAGELQESFDLIMPDLPGFGGSIVSNYPLSIKDFADCLFGLLESLGIEKIIVAGHSMGGYVALEIARRYSNNILGLILVGSQAAADSPEKKAGRQQMIEKVSAEGISAVTGMAEKLSNDPEHRNFLKTMIGRQNTYGVINGLLAMAGREDITPVLSTFKFPVAMLHGLSDPMISFEKSREIKKQLPSSVLIEIPGIGHSPMLEAVKETRNAFLDFIKLG